MLFTIANASPVSGRQAMVAELAASGRRLFVFAFVFAFVEAGTVPPMALPPAMSNWGCQDARPQTPLLYAAKTDV